MRWPWQRPLPPTYPCGFCRTPLGAPAEKHRIGTVHTYAGPLAKYCDGTETPE